MVANGHRPPIFPACANRRSTPASRRAGPVPDRPEWFHEIKHDGYRLIVQREGKTVRLWTRNGYDWSSRYPLIVDAALRHRADSFVLDGEAVLLGVDGIADFNGLHSRKHDDEVHFFLSWAKERIDEMDATLASLEGKAVQMQAETRVKADQFITQMRKKRDEFESIVKKQAEAGEPAWDSVKLRLATELKGFEAETQEVS